MSEGVKCQGRKISTALWEAELSGDCNKSYSLSVSINFQQELCLQTRSVIHQSQIHALELKIRHEVPLILLYPIGNCPFRQHSLAQLTESSLVTSCLQPVCCFGNNNWDTSCNCLLGSSQALVREQHTQELEKSLVIQLYIYISLTA